MKRGTLYYQRQFHNDQGTAEDPTGPEAQLQKPDGSWVALTAPAKQNSKTGLFGGSLDMSNATTYPVGRYSLRIGGTVATAKVVAAVIEFELTEYSVDDIYGRLGAPVAASLSADVAVVDAVVDAIKAKTDTLGGAGSETLTYTLTEADETPISDADVWVTTDEAGTIVVASGRTDDFGVVTFQLDPGTYYIWCRKAGWDFENPDTEEVTA
jgi:hypothetical protein